MDASRNFPSGTAWTLACSVRLAEQLPANEHATYFAGAGTDLVELGSRFFRPDLIARTSPAAPTFFLTGFTLAERCDRESGRFASTCGLRGGPAVILVTGAAGFIGSNVARAFCAAGHDVVGCDRMRTGGKWKNLVDVRLHDLILPEALPAWLSDNDGRVRSVIHLGAVSATTETDVDRIVRNNVRLSLDLWTWCARTGTPMVYASSAATYGDGSNGFSDDEEPAALARLRPLNAYGWSKQLVDSRIVADVRTGRAIPPQWVGLKFFNVYGPGEEHKGDMRSLVSKMMPVIREGGAVKLFRSYRDDYADGEQMRDFVYVDDVVSAIQWLTANPAVSGLYNLGSGRARTWNDIARIAFSCLGREARIEYVEMPSHIRRQYQYFTEAPIEKLRAAGWSGPTTSLEQGVQSYVAATA